MHACLHLGLAPCSRQISRVLPARTKVAGTQLDHECRCVLPFCHASCKLATPCLPYVPVLPVLAGVGWGPT
jgi:hypothetical protein